MSNTFSVRVRQKESWLSVEGGRRASAKLCERLLERCRGERGRKFELTYGGHWRDDPQTLYRASSKHRHVRRFIDRLEAFLGECLNGRWLCKLEFQADGTIHYHVIVLGVGFIPHTDLQRLWGFGFVYIKPLTRKAIAYACKYVAKTADGKLPGYIYEEPVRSVKIVRVSRGFWRDGKSRPGGKRVKDQGPVYGPPLTIGQSLELGSNRCVDFHCNESGQRVQVKDVEPAQVFMELRRQGFQVVGQEGRWSVLAGNLDRVDWSALRRAAALGVPAASAAGGGGGAAPLYSNNTDPT